MGVLKVFSSFGCRRISVFIDQKCRNLGESPVNHKRIYRIIHQFNLILPQKLPLHGFSSDYRGGHVAVAEPDLRWSPDDLEFRCLNGEVVTATFVIDCCDRECLSLVAKSGKGLTPAMVQDALVFATKRRFGNSSENHVPVQFLTDNGAAYTSISAQAFVCRQGLIDCKTPVCSPQSNGITEAFVKILKRDYLLFIDLKNAYTAMKSLRKSTGTL